MITTNSNQPGFLKRLLLAFAKLFTLVLVLVIVVVGSWFIYDEINRSVNSVADRVELNTQRIEGINSEWNNILTDLDTQQSEIDALETAVVAQNDQIAAQNNQIADLIKELAAEQVDQADMAATFNAKNENFNNEIATLNEGLAALQTDVTDNGTEIDELGGTVDGLQSDITNFETQINSLDNQIREMESGLAEFPAEEIGQMRQTIALFRIWELISRARLALAEGNAGLAASDVILAMENVDQIIESDGGVLAESLLPVQERLTLTVASLPDDADTAVRDLGTAWEALDAVLASFFAESE